MTSTAAAADRKRRATRRVGALALAAIVVAVVATALGAIALYHSTDGRTAGRRVDRLTLPDTPNALVAGVDERGALASLAVFTLTPSESGGSIVVLPVGIDATGMPGDRRSLAAVVSEGGLGAVEREAEFAYGITFDGTAVLDRAGLEDLIATATSGSPIELDLPAEVLDADATVISPAGRQQVDAATAASLLTVAGPSGDGALSAEVWRAVAGAAAGSATGSGRPGDVMELVRRTLASDPTTRLIATEPLPADEGPTDGLLAIDRTDLAIVFGQISPAKVSPINPSYAVRLVVPYSREQLEAVGVTASDVTRAAVTRFLYVGANVVSVELTDGGAEDQTVFAVASASLRDDLDARVGNLMEGAVTELADTVIVGVDVVVTLGSQFLGSVANGAAEIPPSTSEPASATFVTAPTSTDA